MRHSPAIWSIAHHVTRERRFSSWNTSLRKAAHIHSTYSTYTYFSMARVPIGIPKALEQSTWCPSMNACSMLGHLFRKPCYPEMAEWMHPALVSPPRSQNRFENWGRGLPRRSLFSLAIYPLSLPPLMFFYSSPYDRQRKSSRLQYSSAICLMWFANLL